MVFPILAVALSTLAGVGAGGLLGGKKDTSYQYSNQTTTTYSPQTTTTTTSTISPMYNYAPQIMYNSPSGTQTKKETLTGATSSPTVAPVLYAIPQITGNTKETAPSTLLDELKPYALVAAIGAGAYFILKK